MQIEIKLSRKEDVEFVIGEVAVRRKHSEIGCTDVLCSDLFPISWKYNTKSEFMTFDVDYETMVVELDEFNVPFMRYYKPAENARKCSKREKELKSRIAKKKEQFRLRRQQQHCPGHEQRVV